jgi:hypothetical protein
MYKHMRTLFLLVDVRLPDWTTIRWEKLKIRQLLGLDVICSQSILNTPTYLLSILSILAQEIANSLVSSVLEFYPEDAQGKNINRLSQSRKWLAANDPLSCAPMVRTPSGDFYLYEPIQLDNNKIVVPLFFFP